MLDQWGGIDALDEDTAEDAATTKVVRRDGYRVRLAPRTVPQPLGARSLRLVWQRQCRWAQLRRHSFPALYVLEPFKIGGLSDLGIFGTGFGIDAYPAGDSYFRGAPFTGTSAPFDLWFREGVTTRVPEPPISVLLGMGLLALVSHRRLRGSEHLQR